MKHILLSGLFFSFFLVCDHTYAGKKSKKVINLLNQSEGKDIDLYEYNLNIVVRELTENLTPFTGRFVKRVRESSKKKIVDQYINLINLARERRLKMQQNLIRERAERAKKINKAKERDKEVKGVKIIVKDENVKCEKETKDQVAKLEEVFKKGLNEEKEKEKEQIKKHTKKITDITKGLRNIDVSIIKFREEVDEYIGEEYEIVEHEVEVYENGPHQNRDDNPPLKKKIAEIKLRDKKI